MFRTNFLLFLAFLGLCGCGESNLEAPVEVAVPVTVPAENPGTFSFQLFEVKDSATVMHGFGYDIYSGSKRMIHQTNIPGEPGNDGFANREEAERVAKLVVSKLEANQGFPTISRAELDSLGITLQH